VTLRLVYRAISALTEELAPTGIPKTHTNVQGQYQYRSIDDVLNRLAPLLSKHRLCVLPRTLERVAIDRTVEHDALLVHVTLKVAFDLVSADDSSCHTVEAFGEALDEGDKATAKAMSAAYKSAMLQTFCIPVGGAEDADASTFKLRNHHEPEPVQGWAQWMRDMIDMIGVCETAEALGRVQDSNRALLKAIGRERPELYEAIGAAFTSRRAALGSASPREPRSTSAATSAAPGRRTRRPSAAKSIVEHA